MRIRLRAVRPALLAGLLAALAAVVTVTASPASTAAPVRHVVIVGLPGLRWSDISASATPTLWRLAGQGSVGSLSDYAIQPLTCPADAWLTLNSAARTQSGRPAGACGAFPAVVPEGTSAFVPGLPSLASYNRQFHTSPAWGALAGAASCATAVGPGAALALADPSGHVAAYLPSPSQASAAVLSRCPLTVVDLETTSYPERRLVPASVDAELARIVADLPSGATLLVTAPGSTASPPHLQMVLVDGPGYRSGLLASGSTRQPGLITLTDLTPTVLAWLGHSAPPGAVGVPLTRANRGSLPATIRSLVGRDTAEQVWLSTHQAFFWSYLLADAVVFGALWLARRPGGWRVAGVCAVSVPAGTFLANLVPWWRLAHPAAWLYGIPVALALVIALVALAGTRRRDPLAPFGVVCLFTLAVLGLDVMTGSRLQLDTPFGLSMIESGRYYGIGNAALGIYGVTALFGAAWLGLVVLRASPLSRRPAVLAVAAVACFAVFASGWPGFGAKVGGTIALVPCFALLLLAVAGIRLNWRRVLLVAVSGLALFAIFALISYLAPVTGKSHIGAFAGDVLHGHAGAVLLRKVHANVGSLAVGAYSPMVPVVVAVTGLMLWRPVWFGLKTVPLAYAAQPLIRPVLAVLWLMPVIGWLADDSGVLVPAAALPLALPLGIAVLAGAAYHDRRPPTQKVTRAVPAIAHRRRPVPAHDLAAEGDRRGEHPGVGRGDPGGQPPVGGRLGLPAADG
ncbi:MAG: hypothetical protein ACRDOU_04980 [Streptosporangiaceae bacterium]